MFEYVKYLLKLLTCYTRKPGVQDNASETSHKPLLSIKIVLFCLMTWIWIQPRIAIPVIHSSLTSY